MKTWIWIIILVAVAAGLGIGGYFMGKKRGEEKGAEAAKLALKAPADPGGADAIAHQTPGKQLQTIIATGGQPSKGPAVSTLTAD